MSDPDHPVSTFLPSGPRLTRATREVVVVRLAWGDTDGWYCDGLPPDAKAQRALSLGLPADFQTLNEPDQTLVLTQVPQRHPHVFEDMHMLAELTESDDANSINQLGIDYVGFPGAKHWRRTGLNQLDPHQQESLEQAGRQL